MNPVRVPETGRPFVLYRADCCRPLDADPTRFTSELSRTTRGDTGDDCIVHTEYGADFWCEIFEAGFLGSKPDKPDLPCIRGNPRN